MDAMEVINNMSSYQTAQWTEATGLPAETMLPIAIGLSVAYIAVSVFFSFI